MQKSLVEILKYKSNDLIMIPAIIKEKELKAYNLYAVLMEKIPSTYKSFPTSFGLSRQQNIIDKHKKFISMMVQVVSQLHELDFTHGDVAYRNLFYNEEEGKIALIDFGRSVYIKNLSLYNQYMFKMYDYYCILNEIFRDNSSILNDDYVAYLSDCLQTALLKQKVFDNLNSSHLSDEKEKSIFRKFRDNLLKPADKASLELKISSADKFKKDKIFKDDETDKYIHISVLRKKWSDPHGPYEDTLNSDFWGVRY
jgi:serine/threonine protein kinase